MQNATPENPFGPGRDRMGGEMLGTGQGPMHEYMETVFAEKLGLTMEELEERQDQGQTFWQIAEEKGYTADEASQMMQDAHSTALDQMVTDGTLTQEQTDWMKNCSGKMLGGNGQGGCTGGGGMMGGRWSRDG